MLMGLMESKCQSQATVRGTLYATLQQVQVAFGGQAVSLSRYFFSLHIRKSWKRLFTPPPATSPRVFGAAANNEIIILIKHQSWGESLPSLGK